MLRLKPKDVAAIETYSVEDFRNWLIAGFKDLVRPDTCGTAFAPVHLVVGHGDITNELKSVYDVLSGSAQVLFRKGLADAISALPTEAHTVPVFRELLHLAGRIKALEVLPKLIPQVGVGFFGMPNYDEGRELFALAIDIVAGMAPASGTADTLRSLVGSSFFRSEYAPLALIALCRSEPERFIGHLSLLRGHFAKFHTTHGLRNVTITARRLAHYIPLNEMASSLKSLELAAANPENDRWLVGALFVGEEAPLELDVKQDVTFLVRRDGEGREKILFPEGAEEAQEFRSRLLDVIFESAVERLPEELRQPNNVPTAVKMTVQNYGLLPSKAVKKMTKRLSNETWLLKAAWRLRTGTDKIDDETNHKIDEEINKLRAQLVKVLRDIPEIWDSCQKEIAKLEPVSDTQNELLRWKWKDGLPALVNLLHGCQSYEILIRYDHPLTQIATLAVRLQEPEPDIEAIEQLVWILLNGKGKPGAEFISSNLVGSLRHVFSGLVSLLERFVTDRARFLTMASRCRIYRAAEQILANLPGEYRFPHFRVQDLAWRAVLLDKARELSQAAKLAADALQYATNLQVGPEPYMWWSRLGDAKRIVAKHSGDPRHAGWIQSNIHYEQALAVTDKDRKTMLYVRQANALADQLVMFSANPTLETVLEMRPIVISGCQIARKAANEGRDKSVPLFIEARLRAALASALGIAMPDQATEEEEKFKTAVEAVLQRNPWHTGAIFLRWRFYAEKGDEDGAIEWLDRNVKSLREARTNNKENLRVANYLEFQAARWMIDLGRQDEARGRFYKMVTETQRNSMDARRELSRIGQDPSQEIIAQNKYEEARNQRVGSQERKDSAAKALQENQSLVEADPDKMDAVPWTRHARLFLLIDKFDTALKILDELCKKYPKDPYVWFHLGEAHYRKGTDNETKDLSSLAQESYAQATTAFQSAWGITSRVDTAHRLAACWARRGQVSEAMTILLEAEKLYPEDGWTKFSLGWLCFRAKEVDQALQHWVDSLQCLSESEAQMDRRALMLAKQAANAIVRFAEESTVTEVPLEHLSPSSLYMLASAASSAGWNRSKIIESMGTRLNSLPPLARRRVPHALRAYLLYLQLAEGEEPAYQWHKRWFERLGSVNDPKLFFEYASGAKGIFRRAVLWSLSNDMSADRYRVPNMLDVVLDEMRWGKFLRLASKWGIQENYYSKAYAAWPSYVSCDELWAVVCQLNTELLRAAFNEVGVEDQTRFDGIISLKLANALFLEHEILPAQELYSDAPDDLLVHTDELSSHILLNSSKIVVHHYATSKVNEKWELSDNQLHWSCYDGAAVPPDQVEGLSKLAFRSDGILKINEKSGIDLAWPLFWSKEIQEVITNPTDCTADDVSVLSSLQ